MVVQKQRELEVAQAWADLREAFRNRDKNHVLHAKVIGLETLTLGTSKEEALKVYFNGIYGYIPKKLVDQYEFRSLQAYVGSMVSFVVEKIFEEGEQRIFLGNRTKALEAQATQFWKKASLNKDVDAFVSGVDKYGVYLVVEGIRVRMEREDYSYKFVPDMTEVVFIGETLNVRVTEFDAEKKHIEVSRKVLEKDPREFLNEYKAGSFYLGTVVNLDVDHGVFVELEPRGLVAKGGFPSGLNRLLVEGEQVNFKITNVNEQKAHLRGVVIVPRAGQKNKGKGYGR